MAVLLLPLAFAGAGYLGFGGIGAAAGWLIGSWLFGPKSTTDNQIFDPGAQEMPRFNQSLRGVTIPILFGTNRVASNVVWVNNFQTIRKETSTAQGGGKGGGSGGMAKGGQQTGTEVSYEYKWDMLFHMGMGPEPYGLFGGWVNVQRMSGDTLLAILNDAVGLPAISLTDTGRTSFAVGGSTSQATQQANTASLTFDDSFFGPGGPTGDASYPAWDYFEAQVGEPARWPYTYYIGFKALSLGSTAAVPQLTWEIGPGHASLTRVPDFQSTIGKLNTPNGQNAIMVGLDNNHYIAVGSDLGGIAEGDLVLMKIEDGTTQTKTVSADLPAPVVSSGPSGAKILAGGGSPYILHLGWGFAGGSDIEVMGRLYKINAAGTLEIVTDYVFVQPDGQKYAVDLLKSVGFGFMSFDAIGSQDSGYPTWICHKSGGGGTRTFLIHVKYQGSLAQETEALIYPHVDDQANSLNTEMLFCTIDTDTLADVNDGLPVGDSRERAWLLPEYHPENTPGGLGNGKWPVTYWLCHLVTPAMIAADDGTSAIITANKATYPNGFIVGYKIEGDTTDVAHGGVSISAPTILNDRFLDENGRAVTKFFEDSGQNIDGSANVNNDYLPAPQVTIIESGPATGAAVMVFTKLYTLEADQSPTGSYLKLRVFVWNPSEQKARLYTVSEGAWFDQVADLGLGPVSGLNNPQNVWTYFDPAQSKLFVVANFGSNMSVGARHVASIWGPMEIGGGGDVLVPYIIYQILTNPVFGMGISESLIDQDSYQAALDYCDAQGFRVSVQYTREQDILGAIEDLLALYGGYLIDSGGSVRFGIATAENSQTPVRVIDNHHLIPPKEGAPPVTVTKGAKQDGFNKVRVNYFDRALDYRQNQYEIGDEVDQDFNGVRFKELPAVFVMNISMAQAVAERALWTNLYARDTYEFKLGWKDADLEPGDVITLVDSFHPELSGGVNVRIAHWQEKDRGKFDVTAVVEVPYYMSASHDVTAASSTGASKGMNDEVLPCSDFRMYELPREFQTSAAFLFAGYNQQSNVKGATLWISPDDISYAIATNAEPYIISGLFGRQLPAASPGNVERDVQIWLMPASGFTTATPTFCQTIALDDVSALGRAAGAGILYCGSEAMAMENLTLLGQNHYRVGKLYRGWGGTLPQAHSSGALWHKHGAGVLALEVNPDKVGTNLFYKVVPYNFAGQAYDVSSITGKEYNIRGAYWLPQEMPGLSTFVQSPLVGNGSTDLAGNVYRSVTSGGCDVTFTWPDAARLEGYGFGGFGKQGFGHFVADLDSHSWRVEVMSGGVVVRSVSVASGPFTYTRAQNSADFAGFGGAFQVRVTPYNNYGDAPVATVKSLNLFW